MTGSDRNSSSAEALLRAPYAAPRETAGYQPFGARGAATVLVPFVPREFRESARDAGATNSSTQFGNDSAPNASEIASASATSAAAVESLFAVPAESLSSDAPEFSPIDATLPADLPWIDAFAADDIEAESEDEWPMGEAGKRLDELTQSLTSIDASRARQETGSATPTHGAGAKNPAEHAMWSEEEWIDIMPTPLPSHTSSELNALISSANALDAKHPSLNNTPQNSASQKDASQSHVSQSDASLNDASDVHAFASQSAPGAESAARALEGLAQRVRAGQVQVPAFKSDVGDEAVLAGLLASMLGWRQ